MDQAEQALRERAKRDNVLAYWDLASTRAGLGGDGNTLVGFAAVFDTWAAIEDWEGTFIERISHRAFNKTVRDKAEAITSQFNHGMDPVFGELPIGKPAVIEPRPQGLWTETPLNRTPLNDTLKEAIRTGSVNGMSIQFRVINDAWDMAEDPPTRTINEIELFEFGPVVFPAYPTTTVGLRSAAAAGHIPFDARIYRAGNMATATLGTANTAATIANATVPTPHEQAAAALAAAQEDLQRQGEAMTAYE